MPEVLIRRMQKKKGVNWSLVVRKAIEVKLRR
jgi:hypothetical protein